MQKHDNSVDIFNLMRDGANKKNTAGLRIVVVSTADPDPLKFVFEGTPLALDAEIFEIPINLYPLRKGDRVLAYAMLGQGISQRWGLITKINAGTLYMATMQGPDSLIIDGINKTYTATDLLIPKFTAVNNQSSENYLVAADIRPLQAGDRVSVSAISDNGKIKYLVTGVY